MARTPDDVSQQRFRLSSEFWIAFVSLCVGLGGPAVLWGGSMNSRMENVEQQQRNARTENREDFREVNRKLDLLMERVK
jgi:hypothetical protein